MTAAEMIAKLKTLAAKAGESLWERANLAKKLLDDRDWIAREMNKDEGKAREFLNAECFGDLVGAMGLDQLLEILSAFPNKEQWQESKFNLRLLWAKTVERRNKPEKTGDERWSCSREKYETLAGEKQEAESLLRLERTRTREKEDEITALREKVRELERENAELKGRVSTLEKILERRGDFATARV